ncbi:MAG TPA: glycerophosphoryl diester phosphodiesterase membrane domain-containing protein [Gaiellaceae bacterium]|nr:glycerophosphoryl diester phosphodiesterase membrane domain-containing protein [Gaiellaceae bacterium]
MISAVLSDALDVYRRLFRRAVVVAGAVFTVVGLASALADRSGRTGAVIVSLVLGLVGGLLVQGALVEAVRDLHEGRPPAGVRTYTDRSRGRLGTLVGASLLYGVGVALGLLAFVVPGLILVARWALVVPLVMIEGRGVRDAFARSSQLVTGQTGRVLVLVVVANLITGVGGIVITAMFRFLPPFGATWAGSTVAGALTVPYEAQVLTVLYYRLTEPDRPVLPA